MLFLIENIFGFLFIIMPLLISVAYFTLLERKVLGAFQRRIGPNIVGYGGLLQPLADGLKLLSKSTIIPVGANKFLFIFAPVLTFFLSILGWIVIPFSVKLIFVDINLGLLYLFIISSLGVYGVILAGWASNSRYAFLGALRSTAQMISYEISFGLIILSIVICIGSFNLVDIVLFQEDIWFVIPLYPMFLLFFISSLAETNRAPFDLPEAEAELVAGYNVEYAAMGFALFFLGEYSNMLLISCILIILFLGGWYNLYIIYFISDFFWFFLKLNFILFLFVWVRAAYPRYRYDQLMRLGWKIFLPFVFSFIIFEVCFLFFLELLFF